MRLATGFKQMGHFIRTKRGRKKDRQSGRMKDTNTVRVRNREMVQWEAHPKRSQLLETLWNPHNPPTIYLPKTQS